MATLLQKSAEPGVIDQDMLIALIIDQGPKGDIRKIFCEDGIKLDHITDIRIEFLNILNIDHLWVMPNLVKLKLSNNIIERIDNLDDLVNLKELDLSFNRIKVMENLNHLVNLEVLLLYNNEISELEGINNLSKLTILSLGNNDIADWNHILYLRKFEQLRSLNTIRNPCIKEKGYKDYLLALVPQLVYYQYKMISDDERQSALTIHYRMISNLEEKEAVEKTRLIAIKEFEDRQALLSKSYVEYFDEDNFFQILFLNDKEGKALSIVNEDAENAFKEFKKHICSICKDIYEFGLNERKKRDHEIKLFDAAVNNGKHTIETETRKMTDVTIEEANKIFSQIDETLNSITDDIVISELEEKVGNVRNLSEKFHDLTYTTWTELMSKEILLHEQLEDINKVIKMNISEMVEYFIETVQGYFSQIRNAEAEYTDTISSIILYYISGFPDEAQMPAHILSLCGDKETLDNNLVSSYELHSEVIDTREETMISKIKAWLGEYIDRLEKEEVERNHQNILEISHFLQNLREQYGSLQLLQHLRLAETDPIAAISLEENVPKIVQENVDNL